MLALPALLLAFVAEELRNGEPFNRLFITPFVRCHHPGQSGRHLGAQGDRALALVRKIVELSDNFSAALGCKEIEWFQGRAVVLAETVAARHAAPALKNVLPGICAPQIGLRERLRVEITKARQTIHQISE